MTARQPRGGSTKDAAAPAPPTARANHAPILLFAFLAVTGVVAYLPEIRAALRAPEAAAPAELDAKPISKPDPLDPLAPLPQTVPRAAPPAMPDALSQVPRGPGAPVPVIPGLDDGLEDPMSGGMPGMPRIPGSPRFPGSPMPPSLGDRR